MERSMWAPLAHVCVGARLSAWGCVHACLGWIHMGVWVFLECCLNLSLTDCPSLGIWVVDTHPSSVLAGWLPFRCRLLPLSQTLG